MPKATVNRNIVYLKGIVTAPFEFSYTLPDKVFYRGYIEVMGLGGIPNRLPIVTEKRILNEDIKVGSYIKVNANLRTRNYKKNEIDKVDVYAFAYDIKPNNKAGKFANQVTMEGYICKPLKTKYTPTGNKLCMTILANNRENGIVNYIPIVIFEENDRKAEKLKVGDLIQLEGRFQSRIYWKNKEPKTAYEVAVSSFNINKTEFSHPL